MDDKLTVALQVLNILGTGVVAVPNPDGRPYFVNMATAEEIKAAARGPDADIVTLPISSIAVLRNKAAQVLIDYLSK